jgi:hypothetical protein
MATTNHKVRFQIAASDRATAKFQKLQRVMVAVKGAAVAVSAATGVIGVAAIAGLTSFTKKTLEAQDKLAKLSQKVNISVEDLAGLQHAGNLAGIGLDQITKAIKSVSTQLLDADSGLLESQRNFRALGVEIKDSGGKLRGAQDIIIELADKFKDMKDGTEKTALAVKLFGRAGLDIIPLLNQGSDALARFVQEGKELNPVTAESARQSEVFNDQMTRLKGVVSSVGIGIVNDIIPSLARLAEKFATAAVETQNFWEVLGGGFLTSSAEFEKPRAAIEFLTEEIKRQEDKIKDLSEGWSFFTGSRIKLAQTNIDIARAKIAALNAELVQQQKDIFINPTLLQVPGKGEFEASIVNDVEQRKIEAAEKKITDFNQKLDEQIKLFGASAPEVAAYKAELLGMNEEQVEFVRFKAEVLEGLKKEQELLQKNTASFTQANDAFIAFREQQDADERSGERALERLRLEGDLIEETVEVREAQLAQFDAETEAREKLLELSKLTAVADQDAAEAAIEASKQRTILAGQLSAANEQRREEINEINEFGIQAARNLQTAFADFLFDPFDKGLKGMAIGFANTVRRMIAEAASAQLLKVLLGDFAGGSGGGLLGGIFGSIVSGIGGFFSGGSSIGSAGGGSISFASQLNSFTGKTFADGGFHSGGLRMVGERGRELEVTPSSRIFSNADTEKILSGGDNINISINTGVAQTVRAEMNNLLPDLVAQVTEAVVQAKTRQTRLGTQL